MTYLFNSSKYFFNIEIIITVLTHNATFYFVLTLEIQAPVFILLES